MQCTPMRAQLPLSSRHPSSFTSSLHPSRLPSPSFCVCVCVSLFLSRFCHPSLLSFSRPSFFLRRTSVSPIPSFSTFSPAFSLPCQFSSSLSLSFVPSATSPPSLRELASLVASRRFLRFSLRPMGRFYLSLWRVDRSLRLCRNTGFSPYHWQLHSPTMSFGRERRAPFLQFAPQRRAAYACTYRHHRALSTTFVVFAFDGRRRAESRRFARHRSIFRHPLTPSLRASSYAQVRSAVDASGGQSFLAFLFSFFFFPLRLLLLASNASKSESKTVETPRGKLRS